MNLYILLNRKIVLPALMLASTVVFAQQNPQYSQYLYNTMSINPGYTGSLETLDIVASYRNQWMGIDGAPITQNFGIHTPLRNDKIGIGLNIENDKIGPANQFYVDGNFSYTLKLNSTLKLGLGLKAGAKIFNVDFSRGEFQNENDPANMNVNNMTSTILGAGGYLYTDNWYLGFSVPDFITNRYFDDVEQAIGEEEIQYFLIGGYVFEVNPDLKFKPTFLAKYLEGFPFVVDVSANFLIKEKFSIGVAYRYEDAISALAGIEITNGIFIGYSYDYTFTDLTNYNSGTHEIVLRYTLPKKNRRINSPRFF
ncbi:MAG: PorP/SprF family type IX secretion system membrane protein [Patiriisocius sp.]|uniref:PorP/SprF family type IX secretion system membrane protein n=1 Tax=Patiriisocius sp. TaxID=2822396 RepID=UPI003EF2CC88